MTAPLLQVSDLSVHYPTPAGRLCAVDRLSFTLHAGEILGMVGESGSGKSSIAQAILGLLNTGTTTATSLQWEGRNVFSFSEDDWGKVRGRRIGMLFQSPESTFNPAATIGRQISEALQWHFGLGRAASYERALAALQQVGMPRPSEIMHNYAFELSGGMCQRAALALALALQPALLLADEPTASLDVTAQAALVQTLAALQRQTQCAMLVISHDLNLIARLTQRVLVMSAGKMLESGDTQTVLTRPQHPYTARLLAALPRLTAAAVSPAVTDSLPQTSAPPLLQIKSVSRTFRSLGRLFGSSSYAVPALRDVSLNLAAGDTLGLVGESGSGKSTLARLIVGLDQPDQGSIIIDGHQISRRGLRGDPHVSCRTVQMVFQNPYTALDPLQRIDEAIVEPLSHFQTLTAAVREEIALAALEEVGLPARLRCAYPHQLSGGERQRVCIARALCVKPKLLICDEVVSALDKIVQSQVLQLLCSLQERHGLAILFISHDLAVVSAVCNRLAIMQAGQIVETGRTADLLTCPTHPYTQSLVSACQYLESGSYSDSH